jgi:hypothetical protein
VYSRIEFVIADDLRHAGAVAQIDEDNLPKIAPSVHPSHKDSFFSRVGQAQRPAGVCSS